MSTAAEITYAALAEVGYASTPGWASFDTPPDALLKAFNIGRAAVGKSAFDSVEDLMAAAVVKFPEWQLYVAKWGIEVVR